MTDNTRKLTLEIFNKLFEYSHYPTNSNYERLEESLVQWRDAYGKQREQEGIKKCVEIVSRFRDGTMADQLRALLTPEPPKPTRLASIIKRLRQIKDGTGRDSWMAVNAEDAVVLLEKLELKDMVLDLEDVLEPASPSPSTLSAIEELQANNERLGTQLMQVSNDKIDAEAKIRHIQEILDMDEAELRRRCDEEFSHTNMNVPGMRCALIRKEIEGNG